MQDTATTTGPLPGVEASVSTVTSWALRATMATLVLIGGAIHLRLYLAGGYDAIPVVGSMFLLNVVASGLVVVGLALRPSRVVHLAGLALSAGTLVALAVTHTVGIAGFTEASLSGSQAVTIASEALASVGFVWLLRRSS